MDQGKNPNPNPNPNPQFQSNLQASHFLQSLSLIGATTPRERRRNSIRRAAYSAMAHAAGPRHLWSRALLRRLRCRRGITPVRVSRVRVSRFSRSDDLRRLVPGGDAMDLCSLLGETAGYISSLTAQVQLMQAIVESANQPSSI